MSKWKHLAGVAVVCTLIAAGCSDSDDSTDPTTPATADSAAPGTAVAPSGGTDAPATDPAATDPPAPGTGGSTPGSTAATTASTDAAAVSPAETSQVATAPEGPEGDAFYEAPTPLPGTDPGDVIWTRPLSGVPDGSHGWLVLYRSLDVAGNPIPVSGIVIVPDQRSADGTVLSWAHGTTGVGDQCAPSKVAVTTTHYMTAVADVALRNGWTFVATDYEGLGTEGVHPYLVGISEGRGVLDMVRAAAQLDGTGVTDASPVLIWGHSQGGQSALMAAELAPQYAPELDVVGTVAVAPAGELKAIENAVANGLVAGAGGFSLMALAGFLDAYPDLPVESVATGEWLALVAQVAEMCTRDAFALAASATTARPDGSLDPAWSAVLDENSPGNLAPDGPVLIVHGDADDTVPPLISERIAGKHCDLGVTVQRTLYPGADHVGVMEVSEAETERWMVDRLAGAPAPSSCPAG